MGNPVLPYKPQIAGLIVAGIDTEPETAGNPKRLVLGMAVVCEVLLGGHAK
jgi:hypothetical protein